MNRDQIEEEIRRLALLVGEPATGLRLIEAIDDAIYESNLDGYNEGQHANEEY